jgi:hypothetical protein
LNDSTIFSDTLAVINSIQSTQKSPGGGNMLPIIAIMVAIIALILPEIRNWYNEKKRKSSLKNYIKSHPS